jgi:hypothetical protein
MPVHPIIAEKRDAGFFQGIFAGFFLFIIKYLNNCLTKTNQSHFNG